MNIENKYLLDALSEAKCVILVKRYYIVEKNGYKDYRCKLEYISPNAEILGMNVSAIGKGFKLVEDYIIPEERQEYLGKLNDKERKDYFTTIRMVGDDGNVRTVNAASIIKESDDTSFVREIVLREITEEKKHVATFEIEEDTEEEAIELEALLSNESIIAQLKMAELVQAFAGMLEIYSTIVDLNGKIVVKPVGPAAYMGEFYDMFERPMYQKLFEDIKRYVFNDKVQPFLEIDDGHEESRVSAAPIYVDGKPAAIWIVCGYNRLQVAKMKKILDAHWVVSKMVSEYLENFMKMRTETTNYNRARNKLHREIEKKAVITGALSKMTTDVDETIEDMLQGAGELLDITDIAFYTTKEEDKTEYYLKTYWNKYGRAPMGFINNSWKKGTYAKEASALIEADGYIFDHTNMTNQLRVEKFHGEMRAVIIYPIMINGTFIGWLFFGESEKEREWTDSEKSFTREIGRVLNAIMRHKAGKGRTEKTNEELLDSYNYLNVGLFIREKATGRVLFSNKKLNSMLGYDFTGKDSRALITDIHDRLDSIVGMRRPAIADNKVTSWVKYIDALNAIVDITEIQIEWLHDEAASIFILRIAQE